jgi:hypothetical protein
LWAQTYHHHQQLRRRYHYHAGAAAATTTTSTATTIGHGTGTTFPINYYAAAQGKLSQQASSTSQTAAKMISSIHHPSLISGITGALPNTSTTPSVATAESNKEDREWTIEDDRRLALLVSEYKQKCRGATTAATRYGSKKDGEWTAKDDLRLNQLVSEYQQTTSVAPAAATGNKRKLDTLLEATETMVPGPNKATKDAPEQEKAVEGPHVGDPETVVAAAGDEINSDKDGVKMNRRKRNNWTETEDKELERIVQDLKTKTNKVCWSTVMRMMPGRDSKQCRDRYLNHLDPNAILNKSAWTEEEDRKLLNFIKKHGTRWRLMQATILCNRTELTIKNRWNSSMKRRYTRFLSKRWGVSEDNIKLLTSRGLLNPGVDIDQMLRVARCKMIDAAYNVGDVESSREMVVSDVPCTASDPNIHDDITNILKKYESSTDISGTIQLRILKGNMADDDSALKPLGILETCGVNSFAYLRAFLTTKFQCLSGLDFRFSVNHLGILSVKQEIDLGPIGAVMKALATGEGTEASPFDLLVVG